MNHWGLQADLARWLSRNLEVKAWAELQLSSRQLGRADVITVKPYTYSRRDIRIYEVKASRSDFMSDVGSGKWRKYIPYCDRLLFACPKGLIKPTDLPPGAGLITRKDDGEWRVQRVGRRQEGQGELVYKSDMLLRLLSAESVAGRAEPRDLEARVAKWRELAKNARDLGYAIGRKVSRVDDRLDEIREAEAKIEAMRAEIVKVIGARGWRLVDFRMRELRERYGILRVDPQDIRALGRAIIGLAGGLEPSGREHDAMMAAVRRITDQDTVPDGADGETP